MGGVNCEKHGPQIAAPFCRHAAEAVRDARLLDVFLQHEDDAGWYTVCRECAGAPHSDEVLDIVELVCCRCIVEWADKTGNGYVARANSPKIESPGDGSPPGA